MLRILSIRYSADEAALQIFDAWLEIEATSSEKETQVSESFVVFISTGPTMMSLETDALWNLEWNWIFIPLSYWFTPDSLPLFINTSHQYFDASKRMRYITDCILHKIGCDEYKTRKVCVALLCSAKRRSHGTPVNWLPLRTDTTKTVCSAKAGHNNTTRAF